MYKASREENRALKEDRWCHYFGVLHIVVILVQRQRIARGCGCGCNCWRCVVRSRLLLLGQHLLLQEPVDLRLFQLGLLRPCLAQKLVQQLHCNQFWFHRNLFKQLGLLLFQLLHGHAAFFQTRVEPLEAPLGRLLALVQHRAGALLVLGRQTKLLQGCNQNSPG